MSETASVQLKSSLAHVSDEELPSIRAELPEVDLIDDVVLRGQVCTVWASFLKDSAFSSIADAPALPGLPKYDLCRHTRQVVKNAVALSTSEVEFWEESCDLDALVAGALLHDASKLVEYDRGDGRLTDIGEHLLHAQIGGVRCLEAGIAPKVAYLVAMHPFTPPHVHIRPKYVELVLLTWADLAAVDPLFWRAGKPTHLDIDMRFFTIG